MSEEKKQSSVIKVASLWLHPANPKDPMIQVKSMKWVAGKGIEGNTRYFDKLTKKGAKLKRHVSIMATEKNAQHSEDLEMKSPLKPGQVRANIETEGGNLDSLIGKRVQVGKEAMGNAFEFRKPCSKMDKIYPGLWQAMKNNEQGLLLEIIVSGQVFEGDVLSPL